MIIQRLTMLNFQCYRGAHNLKLGPGVWAIVARYDDDPEHSNAAGKTTLLEAVAFVLFGQHRHRYEDDWITRDEKEGFAELDLGTKKTPIIIRRSRIRGKSTQLEVTESGRALKGDEAQEYIERLIGLGKEDFHASAYLQQKEHSRFVTGDPAVRNTMVSNWLEMDKLIASEKHARVKAKVCEEQVRLHRSMADGTLSAAKTLLHPGVVDAWTELKTLRENTKNTIVELDEERDALRGQLDAWKELKARFDAGQQLRRQYDAVVEQGKALKASLAGVKVDALKQEHAQAHEACNASFQRKLTALKEWEALKKLRTDGFAGQCPVTKTPCPVPEHVSGCVATMKGEADSAYRVLQTADEKHKEDAKIEQDLASKLRAYELDAQRLTALREQIKGMKVVEAADPGQCPDVGFQIRDLDSKLAQSNQLLGRVIEVAEYEDRYHSDMAQASENEKTSKKWWAAASLLKAAQRRVGEVVLARIEARANELLFDAGIRLEVDISWAREGKGFADECDKCGEMYPSKGGKTCIKCGANRPAKVIQRLEVELSDRSGALDDLAGIGIQLAASEWLRSARGSQWGVLMLDEPFGSLDKTNRLAMSGHILSMLDTFEQAFVISHTPDTAMSMPNRIEVLATINGSSVTVAS